MGKRGMKSDMAGVLSISALETATVAKQKSKPTAGEKRTIIVSILFT